MKTFSCISLLGAVGLAAAAPHYDHSVTSLANTTAPAYTIVVHLYAKNDTGAIANITAKLQEASQVYSNDKETLDWYVGLDHSGDTQCRSLTRNTRFVMQSTTDPRAFTIVERYAAETSQQ